MTTIDQFLEDWQREQLQVEAFLRDWTQERGEHPAAASDVATSQEAFRDSLTKAGLRIKHEIYSALTAPSPHGRGLTMLDVLAINCLHKSKGVSLEELALKYGLPLAEIQRVVKPKRSWSKRRS